MEWGGGGVPGVFEGEDDEHEECAGDEFAEELASFGHKGLRVRAEYGSGGVWCGGDGAQIVPFEVVDCRDVVCVDDAGADEAAEELCGEVDGEAAEG